MATTRITDEDLKLIRDSRKEGERQEDTLHRMLQPAMQPTCSGGNEQKFSESKFHVRRPDWADELKKEIVREVKTAMESALAGR